LLEIRIEILPEVESQFFEAKVFLQSISNKPQVFVLNFTYLNINLELGQFHVSNLGQFV
jgi:hypothetical protein